MRWAGSRAAVAAFFAVCLGAEFYLVFVNGTTPFRIEGKDIFELDEFGAGRSVAHAFLMRGDGLNAVSLKFSSRASSVARIRWTLWRGLRDQPQEMTRVFEGTELIELRPGRQWQTFRFVRDGSSRDRWYTIEVRLLDVDSVAVGLNDQPPRLALLASRDNPERGGVLWVDELRQPGSLVIRAERQGRTPYRRFVAEIEPNLPYTLRLKMVQWAIAIAVHAAIIALASLYIADAASPPRSP